MNDISIFDNRLHIVWNLKSKIRHCHLTVIFVKVTTWVLEKSWICEKATDNTSLSDFFLMTQTVYRRLQLVFFRPYTTFWTKMNIPGISYKYFLTFNVFTRGFSILKTFCIHLTAFSTWVYKYLLCKGKILINKISCAFYGWDWCFVLFEKFTL